MTDTDLELDTSSMEFFFNPRSIAVIGASNDIRKVGGKALSALKKWGIIGKLFAINPKHHELQGVACYPSLLAVPEEVDMAIISTSSESVLGKIEQCIEKKVRVAVIFTSGFAEVGPEGKAMQQKIVEVARKGGIRLLGPNCVGIVNLNNSLMASFASIVDIEPVYPMTLGFVTQSGAFGTMIFSQASQAGVGFSSFVSVGNEADTDFTDFMAYMTKNPATKVIGGYLEGAKNGGKFRKVAEEALKLKKPIMMMKVGRTGAGARAASSHTGSLAGDDIIYDAFFKQMGIIRIESLSELTSFVIVHRSGRMPAGNNIGILSISGGSGVLMADKAEGLGLNAPEFTGKTRQKLESYLPPFGSARNPVDLTSAVISEPEMFGKCLRALVEDKNIHMIAIAMGLRPHMAQIVAKDLIEIYQSTTKPVVLTIHLQDLSDMSLRAIQLIKDAGIPVMSDHLHAIQAMSNLAWYAGKTRLADTAKTNRAVPRLDLHALKLIEGPDALSEYQSKKILSVYGIPVTKEGLASSAEKAVKLAHKIGYPVALKIQSSEIMHKTEANGILLNLTNDKQVREGYRKILLNAKKYRPQSAIQGVLIQEMLKDGVEVIIGTMKDPVFGDVLMFGLGGIFVEALKDVSFRIAPLSRVDAEEMVREIRGYRVLQGMRGKPAMDLDALVDVIMRISKLVTDHGDRIKELDVNPLFIFQKGAKVADALIIK